MTQRGEIWPEIPWWQCHKTIRQAGSEHHPVCRYTSKTTLNMWGITRSGSSASPAAATACCCCCASSAYCTSPPSCCAAASCWYSAICCINIAWRAYSCRTKAKATSNLHTLNGQANPRIPPIMQPQPCRRRLLEPQGGPLCPQTRLRQSLQSARIAVRFAASRHHC